MIGCVLYATVSALMTDGIASLVRRRVQIHGLSPSHKTAPYADERWGLPWSPLSPRYCIQFEMHDRSLWEQRGPEYVESLRRMEVPIYMQDVQPDIPMSRRFPLEEAVALGGDYFNSSIAYMLALAALEGCDVELYGIDNHTRDEWWFERPCNEYWIGLMRGRGLDVWIHPASSLTRFMPDIKFLDDVQHYEGRYGWLRKE